MISLKNSSPHQTPDLAVVSLTATQSALWRLGMPVLDAVAVAEHKKRAKRGMLWNAVHWHLFGMAAIIALICLGRQWGRAAGVAAAAALLASLFVWLVNIDLQWLTMPYSAYQEQYKVPSHVTAAVNLLLSSGVSPQQIGVEYLQDDPILFVDDPEQNPGARYDLIIW